MLNHDLNYRVRELSDMINVMQSEINDLRNRSKEDDLWDNSDLIRRWKISLRTLAYWRSEGLIDYVQLGSKIWYTKEAREKFIEENYVYAKRGEENERKAN